MTYQVIKNNKVATTHTSRGSAETWIKMMNDNGMTGYTIKEVK